MPRAWRRSGSCAKARCWSTPPHRGSQLREGLEAIARTCPIIREVRGHGLMLGLEFHELSPTLLTNFKGFDSSGANWWLVPGHEDLLRTIPALYVQSNLLHEHAIYTQVARSNPRVLRVQPPLIVERGPGGAIPRGAPVDLRRVDVPSATAPRRS